VAPATPTNVGYSHSNGKRPPTPDTNRIVPKLSSDLLNSPVGVAERPPCAGNHDLLLAKRACASM